MPILKEGSSGTAVKIWQTILGIEVTGTFGKNTIDATKKFQKEHGLIINAVVDAFTWSAGLGTL